MHLYVQHSIKSYDSFYTISEFCILFGVTPSKGHMQKMLP